MNVAAQLEGPEFVAHEPCDVRIAVTADEDLQVGDRIEFQFPNSWSVVTGPSYTRQFQIEDPGVEHYVHVEVPGGDASFDMEIHKRSLPFTEGQVRHGRHFVATVRSGMIPTGKKVLIRYSNTYAPYIAVVESVWLRVNGEAPEREPELRVLPREHTHLRVLAPSGVEPGSVFNVVIASLDEFENASATAFENEKLMLKDGACVAEDISFSGVTKIAVSLEEEGVYRFCFRDTVSNAVRVRKGSAGPFWGDIHIHTQCSCDAQGPNPHPYARDVSALDFAAAADHSGSIGPVGFEMQRQWARECNDPGKFAAIIGYEKAYKYPGGHHNIYLRNERSSKLEDLEKHRGVKGQTPGVQELFPCFDPETTLIIPHHTGIKFGAFRDGVDFSQADAVALTEGVADGMRPVMEIYSHHGQSELYSPQHILAYEFNRMRNAERRANISTPGPFYAQDYWKQGHRIGVIASSDEHAGQGGRRHGGIAAVFAEEISREAIFDAMKQRRCYGTTGERILMDFSVGGFLMGEEGRCERNGKSLIHLQVWGTDLLVRVEILRFRFGVDEEFSVILSDSPRPESTDAEYQLEDEIASPSMYYARVTQEPLMWPGMAWSSPVWIDAE